MFDRCKPGSAGEVCAEKPDICEIENICMNDGTCIHTESGAPTCTECHSCMSDLLYLKYVDLYIHIVMFSCTFNVTDTNYNNY